MESLQPLEVVVSETTPDDGERGKKTGTPTRTITFQAAKEALGHDKFIMSSMGRILYLTLYFALFINVLFTHIPTARMYEQASAVSSILATSGSDAITPSSPIKFFNIAQLSDVYDWLNNSFVPAVFVTQDQNGNELPSEDYARIGLFNKGLGGVLFQVYSKSVVPCDTKGSLFKLYPRCHRCNYTDEVNDMVLLPFNLNVAEASNKIAEWKEDNLIDNSTYRVLISVLTYNGELEGFVNTQLSLHFQLGGFIKPDLSSRPMISIPYGKRSSIAADVFVWIWWGMAMIWMVVRAYRVWKEKPKAVLGSLALHFIDFCHTSGMVVFYIIWGLIVKWLNAAEFHGYLSEIADPKAIDVEKNGDSSAILKAIDYLLWIADYTVVLRVVGAIILFLFGFQILGSFRFHPQLNILTLTLGNALKQFRAFFIVFVVIFATFTSIGCMIFGDRVKEFSSLYHSITSCLNMLFGQFDYDSIKTFQFAFTFVWIYMLVVSIVLMNMMLGIVLDAYQEVSKTSYNKTSNRDLANHVVSMSWDMICELYVKFKPGAVLCRGKIRPSLLEQALRKELGENPNASSTVFTLETLKSLFPDADLQLGEAEFQATLKHIEQGISIVQALNCKAGAMDNIYPLHIPHSEAESASPDFKV
ncbi:hypothetical protein V7S43_014994 [Phytophthora oleae]|uniref:Polycystin cation channel PKD1/PKD2 domain-containing protein n=1 Tax=Phytophthora oleae TaxID=2107226 RepID=A0ABD3F0M0_9STRA